MAAITGGTTSGADGTCRSITGTASTRPASATAAPAWRPAPNGSPGPKRIGTPISRRNKSRGAGTGKIQTRLLTNAQKGGMLFYIYRNAMKGKSNGSFLSESRRVVRGGRNPGRVSPLSRPLNGEVGGHGFSPLPETAFPPFWRETGRRAASAAKVGWYHESRLSSLYRGGGFIFYRKGGSPCSRSTKCTMRRSS